MKSIDHSTTAGSNCPQWRNAVRLFLSGEADVDNGHGWSLPWVEDGHEGCRPDLDNEMRRALLEAVGR